jgi:predicted O-linked N-acetylglucosamine transferase (SPINDLY family)
MAKQGNKKPLEQKPNLTIQQALDLAVRDHSAGDLPKAEGIYQQVLKVEPNQPEALQLLGVIAYQVDNNDLAKEFLTKAIAIKPDFAEAHSNLGNALKALGRLEDAVAHYHKAIGIKPDYVDAYYNLGIALQALGRLDDAVTHFHKAIDIKPDFAEAHNNLGITLKDLGRLDDAVDHYYKAIDIKPDHAKAHNNLGIALKDIGRVDAAVAHYHKAIGFKPDYAEAHNNLGIALKNLVRLDEAVTHYHKAIDIKPDFAEAHNNLGNALKAAERLNDAVSHYQSAIDIKPDFAEAHSNLGIALQNQGNVDAAAKQMDVALSYKPEKVGWRIRKALLLPVIPSSLEDIRNRRETLDKAIKILLKQELNMEDPTVEVGTTNFHLAYHSRNNRSLLQDIAKLYIAACPRLTYEAKHCRSDQNREKGVLRIGFLSSFLRDHTVGKLACGMIQYFSRELFEVIVFRPPGIKDHMSEMIDRAADKVISLHRNLERDQKIIEKEELDILFYLDIGMDSYTYFLSFARLAPVQAVTIGHAETSGVPNIDYFVSSEMTEPTGASDYYSEQLIKLRYLPTYYYQPKVPVKPYTRDDYGLPEIVRLYIYPQTLFKIHPAFDMTLGELLRRDTDGRLVLIHDGMGDNWRKLLIERFTRTFPDVVEHVIFVPKMPYEKFLGLLLLADAILDNPYLSGINSGLETFGIGEPIVAWPGKFWSGRCVTACYNQMGLNELIATDAESYLALALRLAQDSKFKQQMQADIKANAHKLYERHEVVREMETFLIAAYKAWKTGNNLTKPSIPSDPATLTLS